jgi:hypothetical protein
MYRRSWDYNASASGNTVDSTLWSPASEPGMQARSTGCRGIMQNVYLDQNMWIYLAQTRTQQGGQARYQEVLTLAETGVEAGLVSFPLSAIHYIETSNRRPWERRQDLAKTMALLSRFHAIAPFTAVVPPEIDRALQDMFDVRMPPRAVEVFGVGFRHAMNLPFPGFEMPADAPVDPDFRKAFNDAVAMSTEWVMLAGLSPQFGIDETDFDKEQREIGDRLASEQERLRVLRRQESWHSGERSKRVAMAATLTGWRDEVAEGMARVGLQFEDLRDVGRGGLTDLIQSIPTLHVASELVRQREAARDTPWTRNDVNDVYALSVAIVYCDVVVTELQWVDLATRSKLHDRYGTVLLKDLATLAPYLVDPR